MKHLLLTASLFAALLLGAPRTAPAIQILLLSGGTTVGEAWYNEPPQFFFHAVLFRDPCFGDPLNCVFDRPVSGTPNPFTTTNSIHVTIRNAANTGALDYYPSLRTWTAKIGDQRFASGTYVLAEPLTLALTVPEPAPWLLMLAGLGWLIPATFFKGAR